MPPEQKFKLERERQRQRQRGREMQNETKSAKSRRKPLGELPRSLNNSTATPRDPTIGKWSLKAATQEKKLSSPETKMVETTVGRNEAVEDDGGLDRLLLVQSDLSSFALQIEELVVQAFNLDSISSHGRNEIDSFRIYLSDTLSSMKPWAARLQKALAAPTKETENVTTESSKPIIATLDEDEESILVDSPEQSEPDSLISPSPLVSWRANCTVDRGRQLFLLTPLPMSKSLSSKYRDSSISVPEKRSSATDPTSSLHSIPQETDDPSESSKLIVLTQDTFEEEKKLSSPVIVSQRECSLMMVTPCFKMSPPKSCTVLEPISEMSHWRDCHFRKATPFNVGVHYTVASESSDEESCDGLVAKFPELLAIRDAPNLKPGKKEKESSPDWIVSPPKSCILMEPFIEKKMTTNSNKESNSDPTQDSDLATSKQEPLNKKLELVESTPVWKEPESSFYKVKRAGENTLKKELWTRFEAASSFGFHLKSETEKFIDKLDEVSFS